jgi:hypothetical protein
MVRHARSSARRTARLLAAVALATGAAGFGFVGQAAADVSQVSGGGFGASVSVSLFGGAPFTAGPTPQVNLPGGGGETSDSTASVRSAPPGNPPPVVFLETGALEVGASGQPGATGSATSTATVTNPNALSDFIKASQAKSTCTANEGSVTGSTTLAGASFTNGPDTRQLPANPEANETIQGVQPDVNDRFRVVLNEQQRSGNSITVNAVHIYLEGPSAVGEIIIAQVKCGVTTGAAGAGGSGGPSTATTARSSTATTVGRSTATTAAGSQAGSGTTSAGSPMANTGSDVGPLVDVASVLVAVGLTVVLLGSRRPELASRRAPDRRP